MTGHDLEPAEGLPPPSAADELASAALDGELDPAEQARFDAEPAVSARRDLFAAVQRAVADVPPLDDGDADRLLAGALAVRDTAAPASDGPGMAGPVPLPAEGTVTPAAPWRKRRRPAVVAAGALATAAALVLVVLVVGRNVRPTSDTAATAAPSSTFSPVGRSVTGADEDRSSAGAAADALDVPPAAPSAGARAAPTTTGPPSTVAGSSAETATSEESAVLLGDLGRFTDRPTLVAAADRALSGRVAAGVAPAPPSTAPDVPDGVGRCVRSLAEDRGRPVVAIGWAVLDGEPVFTVALAADNSDDPEDPDGTGGAGQPGGSGEVVVTTPACEPVPGP